jgi:hypothetical protein
MMSWSISVGGRTKDECKRRFLTQLAQQALGGTSSPAAHARDFHAIVAAANGLVDAQRDDAAGYAISGYGSLGGDWENSDIVRVSSATLNLTVTAMAPAQNAAPAPGLVGNVGTADNCDPAKG